ncbi:lytic murein transglycosylase [Rhizobium sp. KAs_5_22]|nr:lytic murein transglycosylase [Rhizobium sp. KAs_5_22]
MSLVLGATDGGVSWTPLCPAGHLPLKGGDRLPLSSLSSGTVGRRWSGAPISPLEGEMSRSDRGG